MLGVPDAAVLAHSLFRAVRHAAIERGQTVRAIVIEALHKWLLEEEAKEDLQDSIAAEEARKDAEPIIDWDQYVASRDTRKTGV